MQTMLENVSLQPRKLSNSPFIYILNVNSKNLTVGLDCTFFQVLNIHIEFHSNKILFTIWLINLFFMYNFRPQKFEI